MKYSTLVILVLGLLVTSLSGVTGVAQAANGQQCAATSTLRGEICQSPAAGYANQVQCVAAYNACLNSMPALMHRQCVQVDQPNCDRNDDCPDGSCCFVHASNQRNRINFQCQQESDNRWHFHVFDVADCKCDCSEGAFPPPPEGPEGITLACEIGAIDCSGCKEPGPEASRDGSEACAVK